jgi:hypothetical protein
LCGKPLPETLKKKPSLPWLTACAPELAATPNVTIATPPIQTRHPIREVLWLKQNHPFDFFLPLKNKLGNQ